MDDIINLIDRFVESWPNAAWGDAYDVLDTEKLSLDDESIKRCIANLSDPKRSGLRAENNHSPEETEATILFLSNLLKIPEHIRLDIHNDHMDRLYWRDEDQRL
jgi:hypothetical protein